MHDESQLQEDASNNLEAGSAGRAASTAPTGSAPPEPARSDKCHARHAECTSMSPSATPATQSEGAKVKVDVTMCQ